LFKHIATEVMKYDRFFEQRRKATGELWHTIYQKMTAALRMLAYDIPADLVDDHLAMGESTAIMCVKCFDIAIVQVFGSTYFRAPDAKDTVTRVNSANVLDEGLTIGGKGRRMNTKINIRQTRRGLTCIKNKCSTQLAQSQSVPGRPLLAPLYRWLGLEEPVGFNTNYNVHIRCHLVFRLYLCLGLF
jgi:hypothetical protein